MNEIVDLMLKMAHVEHKLSSVYHPRTNGLVERFSKTLVLA